MTTFINVPDLAPDKHLIDVRTPSEFAGGHIAGAVNLPLDQIESRIADLDPHASLVLVCKAGTRAGMAADLIAPCRPHAVVLAGGMDAWYRAGLPVVVSSRTRWSLERQVRLVAGLIVLLGSVLSLTVSAKWLFVPAFIGAGLTFAGLTDFCPMGQLLARMPWNRTSKLGPIRENSEVAPAVKD